MFKIERGSKPRIDRPFGSSTYLKVVEICAYVAATYGIAYTVSGMTPWLKAQGFSYKKPAVVPAKADAAQQTAFIKKYEKLMNTTPFDEPILFGDGVHPTMTPKVTHGWIKKGMRKPILNLAGRTRVNLMGSLDLEHIALTMTAHKTLDGFAMEAHFKELRKRYPGAPQIHLILDRAPYNRSRPIAQTSVPLNAAGKLDTSSCETIVFSPQQRIFSAKSCIFSTSPGLPSHTPCATASTTPSKNFLQLIHVEWVYTAIPKPCLRDKRQTKPS